MNRRTALLSSLFLGGLVPARLLAQEGGTRIAASRASRPRPASRAEDDTEAGSEASDLNMPAGLKGDPSSSSRSGISPATPASRTTSRPLPRRR